jgi:hypothetical protein
MLPQHHRAVGDYLQERPYCPESPLANGSGQKFIARGYHTTGADLCTTSSKKHELNLSKARSAGAISYVAFRTFVGILPFRKPQTLGLQYSHRGHEAWEKLAVEFGSALLRLEAFHRS